MRVSTLRKREVMSSAASTATCSTRGAAAALVVPILNAAHDVAFVHAPQHEFHHVAAGAIGAFQQQIHTPRAGLDALHRQQPGQTQTQQGRVAGNAVANPGFVEAWMVLERQLDAFYVLQRHECGLRIPPLSGR
jgi:hypothetical protein